MHQSSIEDDDSRMAIGKKRERRGKKLVHIEFHFQKKYYKFEAG